MRWATPFIEAINDQAERGRWNVRRLERRTCKRAREERPFGGRGARPGSRTCGCEATRSRRYRSRSRCSMPRPARPAASQWPNASPVPPAKSQGQAAQPAPLRPVLVRTRLEPVAQRVPCVGASGALAQLERRLVCIQKARGGSSHP